MAGETHGFECNDCGFTSDGWPTKKARDARMRQHRAEHETGDPMPELAEES
jgi:hypothetical protein